MTVRKTVPGIAHLKCQVKVFHVFVLFWGFLKLSVNILSVWHMHQVLNLTQKLKISIRDFQQSLPLWLLASLALPAFHHSKGHNPQILPSKIYCKKIKRYEPTCLSSAPSELHSSELLSLDEQRCSGTLSYSQCSGSSTDWEAPRHLKPTLSLLVTTQPG